MHNNEPEQLTKNQILYSISNTLLECAKALNSIDNQKSNKLLDIANELVNAIILNEKDEKDIEKYESILRK